MGLGSLLEGKSLVSQVQISLLISITPFLVSYTLFFYLWVFLDWTLINSLSPSALIFSIGTIVYYMYRHQIEQQAVMDEPANLTLRWNEASAPMEPNVMKSFVSLKEPDKQEIDSALQTQLKKLGIPIQTNPGHLSDILMGKYATLVEYHRPMDNPIYSEKTFTNIIFLHDEPRDKTFRKVPHQIVSFKGQVFLTAAAVIDATFLFWDEGLLAAPVFRVTSNPEQTRLMQLGFGIKPESSRSDVAEAINLNIQHKEIESLMRLQMVESRERGFVKTTKTTEEGSVALLAPFLKNEEEIMRERKWQRFRNKKIWAYLLGLGLLGVFLLWVFGII